MRPLSPRTRFGFLIHDVSRMRRTFIDQGLKPLGITRAQWWALGNISRHADDGMIQTELAKILETGKVSVGGLIDRLEESGLVYRQADTVDRRVKRIFITDKGFEMLEHIEDIGHRLDDAVMGDVSDAEIERVLEVIGRIKGNLREAIKQPPVATPLPSSIRKSRKAAGVK